MVELIQKGLVDNMNKLIDKLIIIIFCMALYIPSVSNMYMIVPILIAVIFSASLSYLEDDRITLGTFILYLVICFFEPTFLFFIPLICYDVLIFKHKWIWALALLPLINNMSHTLSNSNGLIAVLILVAYLIKNRTLSLQKIKYEYYSLRDNSKEKSMQLEQKNKELMEKQDYEINLATLKERNRIARDIHDNVGHMLSRSILQIGAILATTKDETEKENFRLLKDTLSEAMDSIRSSVHDLHEESIDLEIEIQNIISNFKFCPVEFDYDIEAKIDKSIKYCFISVTKEALSNIIKHSNATKVSIKMMEHPALYQLVIHDNGLNCCYDSESGIGLKNIKDRVEALSGNVNISFETGFRIFITIPKS